MKEPFYLMFITVLIFTACQSKTKTTSDDINTIRNLSDQSIAAVRAKDINNIISIYSSDAIEMPPNEPIAVGIEAIKKGWELWFSDTTLLYEKFIETVDNIQVSSSGDLGYVRTTSHIFIKTTNGIIENKEKTIYIYKKIEGAWKCIIAIWNDNKPMEGQ
jgi:ketosteroid isomerase-like protein